MDQGRGPTEFELGAFVARAQAAEIAARTAGALPMPSQTVYLLWRGDVLLGIFGTETRATQELNQCDTEFVPERAGRQGLRIERRVVHS